MTPPGKMIAFAASSQPQLDGYLARPEGGGPFPGMVVIHEAYGLNENMRDIARRFAGEGYVALAVDLFGGRNLVLCMMRMFGGMILKSLDHAGVRDLKAALTFLAEQPAVDGTRLGAIGFCMGGSLAIALSCADNRLKAIAPYYAMNPRPLGAVARACPVVGSYPDPDFTTKAGRALDDELDKHDVEHDIKIYPGAKHSFFNDQGGNYDAGAATDSWRRVLAFFGEHV
ncbi:MAG TPA: dienelactone hydrolase family protein [Roseiflexaceae bacterium]|nr:dienelactone hydrolase family protein [Roseiflexaceae bacterium]